MLHHYKPDRAALHEAYLRSKKHDPAVVNAITAALWEGLGWRPTAERIGLAVLVIEAVEEVRLPHQPLPRGSR